MKNLLELKNVDKIYHEGKENAFQALNNIDLTIQSGDFICIMGPSGSGKTTLMNILTLIDRPSHGLIKVFDQEVDINDDESKALFRKNQLGYIFQDSRLIDSMTLLENIVLKLDVNKKEFKEKLSEVHQLAKMLHIDTILNQFPYECSSGQNQRASMIRAMIHRPMLLVGDEPTGNLDHENSKSLMEEFVRLNQMGVTILLVSHDPLTASYAKKVIYLEDGQLTKTLMNEDSDQFYDNILTLISGEGGMNDERTY